MVTQGVHGSVVRIRVVFLPVAVLVLAVVVVTIVVALMLCCSVGVFADIAVFSTTASMAPGETMAKQRKQ